MRWQALRLELGAPAIEAFCDALLERGALSVTLEDAEAGSGAEQPRYGEPGDAARGDPRLVATRSWARNRVSVLLAPEVDAAALVAAAAQAAGLAAAPRFERDGLDDEDWVRRTQAQFAPIAIGERLWVVPSWHAPPADPSAIVLRLDPGTAFGTGSHPSTRMVLRWLEQALVQAPAARLLDYGCGSGILSIAAARLGAQAIDAVDLDPLALAATADNARRNDVALRALAPEALPAGTYDMLLANILAGPLIALAPLLAGRAAPGARIALSGILESQADEVCAAYAGDFGMRRAALDEDWVLLEGVRDGRRVR